LYSEPYYRIVGLYEFGINDLNYSFYTLVSRDGQVAWMPDSEQQHVNPQYRDGNEPVRLKSLDKKDLGEMISEIVAFRTKEKIEHQAILTQHSDLASRIYNDLKSQLH
jgi:hypothetical protein